MYARMSPLQTGMPISVRIIYIHIHKSYFVSACARCLPAGTFLPELLHVRAVIAITFESDWLSTQAQRIIAETKREEEEAAAAAYAAAEAAAAEAAKKRAEEEEAAAQRKREEEKAAAAAASAKVAKTAGAVGGWQLPPGFVFEKGELKYVGVGQ